MSLNCNNFIFFLAVIIFVLIQLTYRRKKIKTDEPDGPSNQNRATSLRRGGQTYGFYQTVTNPLDEEAETSTLIPGPNYPNPNQ